MFSNVPILLTWLRIMLIPVFVAVYYVPDGWLGPVAKNWTAMTVFAIVSTLHVIAFVVIALSVRQVGPINREKII